MDCNIKILRMLMDVKLLECRKAVMEDRVQGSGRRAKRERFSKIIVPGFNGLIRSLSLTWNGFDLMFFYLTGSTGFFGFFLPSARHACV